MGAIQAGITAAKQAGLRQCMHLCWKTALHHHRQRFSIISSQLVSFSAPMVLVA